MNKVLVIGAARSGIEVSKLLNLKGYEVYLTDMKKIENKDELNKLGIKRNGTPPKRREACHLARFSPFRADFHRFSCHLPGF